MTEISTKAQTRILEHQFHQQDVQILRQQTQYQGFFRLDKVFLRHRLFAGGWTPEFSRELFIRDLAVGVLLFDPWQDTVILLEQFRIGALTDDISPWQFELVAGILEEGEQEAQVAHRETYEEAGCTLKDLLPLYSYWASPGGNSERLSLYCGIVDSQNAAGVYGLAHENEDIRTHVLPRTQVLQALQQGEICNAMTLIALQWLALHHQELRARYVAEV
ncbi:ADP-ribose pyrophosphatase [Allopseudospirillum japonicum]|uniref:ADP-ribose pyrophosphatase n=1 Tax=Allopseudospirillum japonicum TaxID=64971 RepID=A0A1H6T5W9_9GAMM|nr:NUDIX domain-containing protein [Allopseudospirillum japonicum]SEI71192.1 ADP-ribose pyrophosphatase [Allopseudospirillum japonicum]